MPKSRCAGGNAEMSRPAWMIRPEVCGVETGDGAQQRRLAAARRAEETDEFGSGRCRARCRQRGELAELLGDALDAQVGLAAARPLSVRHDLNLLPALLQPRKGGDGGARPPAFRWRLLRFRFRLRVVALDPLRENAFAVRCAHSKLLFLIIIASAFGG